MEQDSSDIFRSGTTTRILETFVREETRLFILCVRACARVCVCIPKTNLPTISYSTGLLSLERNFSPSPPWSNWGERGKKIETSFPETIPSTVLFDHSMYRVTGGASPASLTYTPRTFFDYLKGQKRSIEASPLISCPRARYTPRVCHDSKLF